ncbi:hypothetical protein SK128_006533 [Halocaridina rubra]|uniref:Uncharacterized protein n=1 Tax=Halocaridina rubra TaxID=373956 RepID=A0AAN8WP74_HALRR
MDASWTWPLVTSVLRLVFISTLTVVNGAALYRLISSQKYKQGQRHERILLLNIMIVSLVYLTVIWAPFTFTALKHDISDLYQTPKDLKEELNPSLSLSNPRKLYDDINVNNMKQRKEDKFTVEYIDILPGHDVFLDPSDIQEKISVEYIDDEDRRFVGDITSDEFAVEYIDIRTGEPVKNKNEKLPTRVTKRAVPENLEATWTVFFHSQAEDISTKKSILSSSEKEKSDSHSEQSQQRNTDRHYWSSSIQDLVTSSCAYSIAYTAVLRLIIKRKLMVCADGPLTMGLWSGFAVGVPGAITLLVRTLGRTTTHFAPHQPEYTTAGYFLYNIICDVHISEEYVVSVFLEWVALFTLLLLSMAVMYGVYIKRTNPEHTTEENYGTLHEEGDTVNISVESRARDVVLFIGAIWSWPIKPLLVLILFCIYGSHWTNLVCWIGHVVVAIPVVFIPLAVFLSRPNHGKTSLNIYVIDEDPDFAKSSPNQKKEEEARRVENGRNHLVDMNKVQNTDTNHFHTENLSTHDSKGNLLETAEKDQTRENLKFYLGKDIFNYGLTPSKKEDRQIILANAWGDTSISEA